MGFRVSARTILHLGSELISSDGVAFYELVKNSLDANADNIDIRIVSRIEFNEYDSILRELNERHDGSTWVPDPSGDISHETWEALRTRALQSLVKDSPGVGTLEEKLASARSSVEFVREFKEANFIDIEDNGEGMSMKILREAFLNIGTSFRARQRQQSAIQVQHELGESPNTTKPILGEKGLGRLSVMRLGDSLEVKTAENGSNHWNMLTINWNQFAMAADKDLTSIQIDPYLGDPKEVSLSGTRLHITGLKSLWSDSKANELIQTHFAKLADPFNRKSIPLNLSYNGVVLSMPEFTSIILDQAHGKLTAQYDISTTYHPLLSGLLEYRLRNRRQPLNLTAAEISHLADDTSIDTLNRLGPFKLEVYWFNRRILTKIEGIGDMSQVRRLIATWAGGISLYRDGYRVNPYGGPNDDWLDLDRDAFSTSGFKLNRGQIVGRINITQMGNPCLTDQTNREGLIDCPEKTAFVSLVASVMELFRQYLVNIDDELKKTEDRSTRLVLRQFRMHEQRIQDLLPKLNNTLARVPEGRKMAKQLKTYLSDFANVAAELEQAAKLQDERGSRVIHLASVGLLIEGLAHELYRASANALKTIALARSRRDSKAVATSLRVLDSQMKTLQKRLKVLDPISTSARQTKESFELTAWISDVVTDCRSRYAASNVSIEVIVLPDGATRHVRAVKGMFVQVIENLISNSTYWIVDQHARKSATLGMDPATGPIGRITVEVDPARGQIVVTDNGPGIPEERRELVFTPFFSTKRQKAGRGLGLYIAREIAEYHGGSLELGEANEYGMINSMIFDVRSVFDGRKVDG